MAIRKIWNHGCSKAKSKLCQEISPYDSVKGTTGDLTAAEHFSSLGHGETQPEFDNFLGDFEDIHPGKIITNPDILPGELWTVKIRGQHDEWKYWNLDQLLHEFGLPTRQRIREVLNFTTPLCDLDDKTRGLIAAQRRVVRDALETWRHLKADAEEALSKYLKVDRPGDFAALSEERFQEYERNKLWNSCSKESKYALRWTWSYLPGGMFQNYGWRGVLRCVATLEAKDLHLGEPDDIQF